MSDGTQDLFRRLHRPSRLIIFLGCLFSCVASLNAASPGPETIVCFGDSLTAGYGLDDPATESYPARLEQKIEAAHLPYHIVNAGLSGETTSGGLRRVDWILRQPVDVFILALGANDGLRGIEPRVSRENLQRILDRVRAKNPKVKILLAGMRMPASIGEAFAHEFAAMFPELAKENHADLVPFLLEGVGGHPELNQPDQIHPTAEGHAIVADTVWKNLRPLLE